MAGIISQEDIDLDHAGIDYGALDQAAETGNLINGI